MSRTTRNPYEIHAYSSESTSGGRRAIRQFDDYRPTFTRTTRDPYEIHLLCVRRNHGPDDVVFEYTCLGTSRELQSIFFYVLWVPFELKEPTPRAVVGLPRTVVGLPRTVVGLPRIVVGLPRIVVGLPRVVVGLPRVVVGLPHSEGPD
jgi:hypothetical protein